MIDAAPNNALAEVAFALAMAFFSLLVVSLVSMSTPQSEPPSPQNITFQSSPFILAKPAENAPQHPTDGVYSVRPEQLILYVKGRYYDASLTPISFPLHPDANDLILGVDPALSMAETQQAQEQLAQSNIHVMPLNQQWLDTLKQAGL